MQAKIEHLYDMYKFMSQKDKQMCQEWTPWLPNSLLLAVAKGLS